MYSINPTSGRLYTVSISMTHPVSNNIGYLAIEPVLGTPVILHSVFLGQTSLSGDASATSIQVDIYVDVTTAVSDFSTEIAIHKSDVGSAADVQTNTLYLTAGGRVMHSSAWNVNSTFIYEPEPHLRPFQVGPDAIAIGSPTLAPSNIAIEGFAIFEELG